VVPGGNLLFLARQYGYRVTGVDFSPRVHDLGPAFAAEGIDACFVESDFFTWNPPDRFDLVCAFGFFQHFRHFRSVIARHWDLVKPGGMLLATVPALTPFQLLVRRVTYRGAKFRSMLAAHNRRVMRLSVLRHEVERCAGAEILFAQYIREMTIWFDGRDPEMQPWAPAVLTAVGPLVRAARRFRWSSHWFSPEILVLARKNTGAVAP
jgi:trans-aconitate methyltransferase